MNKKGAVLITGGAGYIGSHIGFILAGQGYQVVILDKVPKNDLFTPKWATLFHGDYADTKLLDTIFTEFPISAVVHCASLTSVPISVQEPLNYYHNNVAKTIFLLESMIKHNVLSLVFSSSCAVYGNPKMVPLTESHPLDPVSPYGTTKMMVEQLLKDCSVASQLRFVSLRYFNVAGVIPDAHFAQPRVANYVIPQLLQAARSGDPFYVFGNDLPTSDGTCIRDYVHVHDIADAHYKALLYLEQGKPSELFNIGTGHGWSVKELITAAQEFTHKEIQIIVAQQRPGDPAVLVADASKATALLGWQPHYSNLEYCLKTVWGG
jgi:UDP-glucose 4-epimerase